MPHTTHPHFPPLTMLPLFANTIAGALEASKEQLASLLVAEKKPYVLDDETVSRVIKAFREQIKSIAQGKDICAHWKKREKPTSHQIRTIEKTEANIAEMEKLNQKILFLAEHYQEHTIDKMLAMDDEELALSFLKGSLYSPIHDPCTSEKNKHLASFRLPSDVTCHPQKMDKRGERYLFRHTQWGELGRIDVIPHGGQSQITAYVAAGDPRDPLTDLRHGLFRTIALEFNQAFENKYGAGGIAELPPFDAKSDGKIVESKIMVCLTCDAPVALLIFAEDAHTPDQLEDYVRMMYSKMLELNLPTWVIGAEKEVVPGKEGVALVLPIWPKRKKAEKISSLEFEPMLYKIQSEHCR